AALVDWGSVNQPMDPERFATLKADMLRAAQALPLFEQRLFVGADPAYQRPVRVLTEYAWHSLFAHTMFVRPAGGGLPELTGDGWTVLDLPSFRADPARHGTRTDTVIAMDMSERVVLVANTEYAGE